MDRYDAYILRVWRRTQPEGTQWRCRLEHLPGGEQRQFVDPALLLAFLQADNDAGDTVQAVRNHGGREGSEQ